VIIMLLSEMKAFKRLIISFSMLFISSPLGYAETSNNSSAKEDTQDQDVDPRAHLGERTLKATRRSGEVIIDGLLDEEAWGQASESVGFVERTPEPGATPPQQSSVRVLYDEAALYVGVRMSYDPAQPPVAWELRRDNGSLWSDDAVTLKIDPRKDRRTTLGFALNAAGASLDLIALDNGKSFLTEYDMVWEGASSVQEDAWYAEYRIPYTALAFEAGDDTPEPGFNVSRDHPARQATDDWTLLPPEFGPASAIHFGTLKGLEGVQGGRPLIFMPYLGLNALDSSEVNVGGIHFGDELSARLGADLRVNFNEGAWLEVSALTDFAQVDLDDALLNLDRFPLFFPERRPFFLNGTDVFTFGAFGAAQPFFSRRIGLTSSGDEVPLYGGFKVYSRSGRLRYGLLSTLSGVNMGDALESATVARSRYEIGEGYVGLILTHSQSLNTPTEAPQRDLLWQSGFGVDLNQRFFNKKLELSSAYSGVLDDAESSKSGAYNGVIQWRGEDYQTKLTLLHVGASYAPKLGFVRRSNYSSISGRAYRVFYRALGLNNINFGPEFELSWDANLGEALDRSGLFGLNLTSRSGWRLELASGVSEKVVSQPFELAGESIAPGRYQGENITLSVRTPFSGARLRAKLTVKYDGAFFGGQSYTYIAHSILSLSAHLRLNIQAVYSQLELPTKEELIERDEQAWNGSLVITPTTNIQLDLVGQLNSQASEWVGLSRLRWRWAPGSDLFLVYRLRNTLEDYSLTREGSDQWSIAEQRIMFKIVWRNDLLMK
jgi:hypothetical protein